MRVLVTGASGFIGRRLVYELVDRGHEVFAASRSAEVISGATPVSLDLAEPGAVDELPAALDTIVHLAALINVEVDNLPLARKVNVEATGALVDFAVETGVERFVYGSTGGVYGCGPRPFDEADSPAPLDLYGMTKAQAELEVLARRDSISFAILRYAFPYDDGTPNPIQSLAESVLAGAPIALRPDGGPQLNPIYVGDAVAMTARACDTDESAIWNVAGSEVTSFRKIAEHFAAVLGAPANLVEHDVLQLMPYYRSDLLCKPDAGHRALGQGSGLRIADGLDAMVRNIVLRQRPGER